MQTFGYERSAPWRQSLALLDYLRKLTDTFHEDPFGMAGRIRSLAADLPPRCAIAHEQADYDSATQHAQAASEHLFKLWLQAQVAAHLALINPRLLRDLRSRIEALDNAITDMPDDLFEDDGQDELAQAA